MKTNLFAKLRTWGFMLSLFLCFVSCEWDFWGGEDTPEAGYYQIPTESLAGWDEGVCYFDGRSTNCEYYIVSGTDSVDGSVTVCLNAGGNRDVNKAVAFHFASNGDVLKVAVAGLQFNGLSGDAKVEFTVYDGVGEIAGHFTVPYMMADDTASPQSSVAKIMDFDRFADEAWILIGDSLQAKSGLDGEVLRNAMGDYLSEGINGEALTTFKGQILSAESITNLLRKYYEQEMARYMGSASIEITSVAQTSDSIVTVRVCISKNSSIPSLRTVVHEGAVMQTDNRVMYGIAIGSKVSTTLHSSRSCTDLLPVSAEDTVTFTFDIANEIGKSCYFRPYLIPEHCLSDDGEPLLDCYNYVRYGTAGRYIDLGIEFSKFKQIECVRSESGSGYVAEFFIDAKIPYLFHGMENWGFTITTSTGYYAMPYRAKKEDWYKSIPTEMNFKCKLQLLEADVTDCDLERISNFTITPFVEFKNTQPTITHFENLEATILVKAITCSSTEHPHAVDLGLSVKWACCNVDAPNPWKVGKFYAWGETESRSSGSVSKYKYVKDLDNDGDYWDDDANWIDIGTEISGTSYDVAHVKWGKGWRMPTIAEVEELYNECTWKWVYSGLQVTGPNGRTILLPSTGRGENIIYGNYWIGTLSQEERKPYNAYNFYFNNSSLFRYSWDYRHRAFAVRPVKE